MYPRDAAIGIQILIISWILDLSGDVINVVLTKIPENSHEMW